MTNILKGISPRAVKLFAASLVLATMFLLTGCASVNPDVVEQNLRQSQVYPPVILTTNTIAIIHSLATRFNMVNTINMGIGSKDINPQIITDGIHNILLEKFPQSSKGKLRLIFDAHLKIGWHSGAITTLQLAGTFMDGNKTVATVSGQGSGIIPYPAIGCGFQDAANAAFADFANNLDGMAAFVPYRWPNYKAAAAAKASVSKPKNTYSPPPAPPQPVAPPQNPAPSIQTNVPPPNFNAPLPGA